MALPRIFVSHSNHDNDFTAKLVEDLKELGGDVWVDFEQIASGNFARSINDGLGSCEWVVLVKTPNSLSSEWVRDEIDAAANLKVKQRIKNIFIVTAGNCSKVATPPMWDTLMEFDVTQEYARPLASLAEALGLSMASSHYHRLRNYQVPKVVVASKPAPPATDSKIPSDRNRKEFDSDELAKYIGLTLLVLVVLYFASAYLGTASQPQSPKPVYPANLKKKLGIKDEE